MDRRRFVALSGAGLAAACAGCVGSGDDGDDAAWTDDPEESDAGERDDPDDGIPGDLGDEPLDLGEAVVFYTEGGGQELSVRLTDPSMTTALITDRRDQGLLASDHPDADAYLTVQAEVENIGEEPVDLPSTVELALDGSAYAHVRTALEDEYTPNAELRPGEAAVQTLVFDVPDRSTDGVVAVEWGRIETVTAEWSIDLAAVDRDEVAFTNLSTDEELTVGTEDVQYTLWIEDVDREAGSVFVTLGAENTGTVAAADPTIRGTSLLAAGETFEERSYGGDDAFDVDELDPGERETGVIAFDRPADVDDYRFRLQLTMDLAATWVL